MFSKVAVPSWIPIDSLVLSAFHKCQFFLNFFILIGVPWSHSFNMQLPKDKDVGIFFICIFAICISSLHFQFLGRFVIVSLLLSFKNSFSYIMNMSFIRICFEIFLPVWLLFIFLTVSFTWHNFLILICPTYQFPFPWIIILVLYLKTYQTQGCLDFPLEFSFRSSIVLCLIFRYNPLWVNFAIGIRSTSRFIFRWILYCHSAIYWKDYSFSIELPVLLCQRPLDYICVGIFLDLLFFFHQYCAACIILYLYSKSWNRTVSVLWLCSFSASCCCSRS